MSIPILRAESIHKTFGDVEILKGIDLSIIEGEIVSIVGASGAGKTTLLQILGTLSRPDRGGHLYLGDREVSELSATEQARVRNREIGFVFQSHQLLPEFTALENVMMSALIGGQSSGKARRQAQELLSHLGLSHRQSHKPSQMSGGECQRVAVARSLINHPSIVLADEPSGSLDSHNKEELHDLFFRLCKERGQTFVISTHDLTFASRADRMITLCDGLIAKVSGPKQCSEQSL